MDPKEIKELRESLGLTKQEFATQLDCSVFTVTGWEMGKRKPSRAFQTILAGMKGKSKVNKTISLRAGETLIVKGVK